jgi:NLR family CARD domain-containing protein 3
MFTVDYIPKLQATGSDTDFNNRYLSVCTFEPIPHARRVPPTVVQNLPKWAEKINQQEDWKELIDPLSLKGVYRVLETNEILDEPSLLPFLEHLRNDGIIKAGEKSCLGLEPVYNVHFLEFDKGILYADGRMDLYNMLVGPNSLAELMEALKTNSFVKHLLLGYNMIGPLGVTKIASFISDRPESIETWYLAVNNIDSTSLNKLVGAMLKSPNITSVWLQGNPLLPASSRYLFRLISKSASIRTLDLSQTGLGNFAVGELFFRLAHTNKPVALRQIYLRGTGVARYACAEICKYLATSKCALETLDLSLNPIGDDLKALIPGVVSCETLQRLSLQSCGLKGFATAELLTDIKKHPSLKVLDLGQAYQTESHGMRFNWLTDECVFPLTELIDSTPIRYLNLSYVPMSMLALNSLFWSVLKSSTLVWFFCKPIRSEAKSQDEVKIHQIYARVSKALQTRLHENAGKFYWMEYEDFEKGPLRELVDGEDLRCIDSVYRSRYEDGAT